MERGKGRCVRIGKSLARRMGKTEMGSKHFLTETKWQPRFFPKQIPLWSCIMIFKSTGFWN